MNVFPAILLVLVVVNAEELKKRPEPRQLFREGIDNNARQVYTRRTPATKTKKDEQEYSSIDQLPLSPQNNYDNYENYDYNQEEDTVPKDTQNEAYDTHEPPPYKAQTISKPRGPASQRDDNGSENNDEYIDTRDQADEYSEYPETDEVRSPYHRYEDEVLTTQPSKTTTPEEQVSPTEPQNKEDPTTDSVVPEKKKFNPFSQFKSDFESSFNDPPVKQNSGEQFHESSSNFEFSAKPFSRNRFSEAPVQERTFDAESAAGREIIPRSPVPSFSSRPSQRFSRQPQYKPQPSQNAIYQNPRYEETQRPKRPVVSSAYRPQQQLDYQPEQQEQPADYYDYTQEEEKPDRLADLLRVSKFTCVGRKDGYYADEDVDCEVFHFCQDNGKHSWLCPNGAAFHQVHLICMPRSDDNICTKSSKFHFVNDFLYKEVGNDPKKREYVERYYPQGFESGVANIPHVEGEVPPQAVSPRKYYQDDYERPAPPPSYQTRHQGFKSRKDERVEEFQENDREVSHKFSQPERTLAKRPVQTEEQAFFNTKKRVQLRPQVPSQNSPSVELAVDFALNPFNHEEEFNPRFDRRKEEIPREAFVEPPSGHFQLKQPQFFDEGREQIQHNRRSEVEAPIYRPRHQGFPERNLQALHSMKHLQYKNSPDRRRPHSLPQKAESSLNPLSFFG